MAEENKKEASFTQGPIFGLIVRFALPVLVVLVLQAAYGAVDLLVVGQFGDAARDAVGTTIVLFFIIGITLTVILEIFAGNIAEIMRRRKQPEKMY